jgi:hypothetical protein
MLAAGHLRDEFSHTGRSQRWSRIVDEDFFVLFDFLDVGVSGDRPERFETFRLQITQRVVATQPGELIVYPCSSAQLAGLTSALSMAGEVSNTDISNSFAVSGTLALLRSRRL